MNTLEYNPLVTVIVSTYNRKFFLKKTVESILCQTYKKLEIIIVNDDTKDSLQSFVSAFNDSRLRLLEIPHSGRPAVPRNFGIFHAAGELIAFCDDDDIFSPNKIEEQVKAFRKNRTIKLCYTNSLFIDENDEILKSKPVASRLVNFEGQLLKNNIVFSTVMVCKSILEKGLSFDERPILKASEDYIFIMNIVYEYPIYFIAKPLLKYRVHKIGISHCPSVISLLKYYVRIVVCMFDFLTHKKISFQKFIYLVMFHLKHVMVQILFLYRSYKGF